MIKNSTEALLAFFTTHSYFTVSVTKKNKKDGTVLITFYQKNPSNNGSQFGWKWKTYLFFLRVRRLVQAILPEKKLCE